MAGKQISRYGHIKKMAEVELKVAGCACDIPSHAYTLNFALNPDWPRFFSYAPDIQKYLEKVCDVFDLRKYITFNTEATRAEWKDDVGKWKVTLRQTTSSGEEREFQEEIQAKLTNISYLGCLENLFTFNGKQGHELLQVYQCDFVDAKFYELESLVFAEGKRQKTALWVDIALFKSGELLLVPEPFLALL